MEDVFNKSMWFNEAPNPANLKNCKVGKRYILVEAATGGFKEIHQKDNFESEAKKMQIELIGVSPLKTALEMLKINCTNPLKPCNPVGFFDIIEKCKTCNKTF